MSETAQIGCGSFKQDGIIPEFAETGVAGFAQQTSDYVSNVTVVDGQFCNSFIPNASLGLSTNGAHTGLSFEHFDVLLHRNSVDVTQVRSPEIGDTGVLHSTLMKGSLGFRFSRFLFGRQHSLSIALIETFSAGAIFTYAYLALVVTVLAYKFSHVTLGDARVIALALYLTILLALLWRGFSPRLSASYATALAAETAFERAHNIFIVTVFAQVGFYVFHVAQSIRDFIPMIDTHGMKFSNVTSPTARRGFDALAQES